MENIAQECRMQAIDLVPVIERLEKPLKKPDRDQLQGLLHQLCRLLTFAAQELDHRANKLAMAEQHVKDVSQMRDITQKLVGGE